MDILHLLVRVRVKFVQSLPGWSAQCFLEIAVQAPPSRLCSFSDSILSIHLLRSLTSFVFLIK